MSPSFLLPAIPTVETARLVLRGHTASDLDACFTLWSDPEVVRHIGGKPSTREDAWSRVLRYAGHWALMGFGFWVVEEKASGRYAGEVGLARFERAIEPPFGETPEAGWVLAPWAQGRGYATEAVRAALGWMEQERGMRRAVCMIDVPNLASIRVAERCGFKEQWRGDYKGEPAIVFSRETAGT
ncbi:MAG: GNAT family N-acetyltransferase [Byssovorax sp.]